MQKEERFVNVISFVHPTMTFKLKFKTIRSMHEPFIDFFTFRYEKENTNFIEYNI
jgi:hypothetical protein